MEDRVGICVKLDRALAEDDVCPRCLGELDTGWECNNCDFDAIELVGRTVEKLQGEA